MPQGRRLEVRFFRTEAGNEPVREWLRELPEDERRTIGEDIWTVQIGWPLGMPVVRKIEADLWEIRSRLPGRIARVLFTVVDDDAVLLHGFIKKSQAIPQHDLETARNRKKQLMES